MAGRQSQSSYDYGYDEEPGPRSPRDTGSMGQRYINVDDIDPEQVGIPGAAPEDVELTSGSARETDHEQTDDQSGPDDKMKGLFGKKDKKNKKDSKDKKEKKSKEKKPKEKKEKKNKTTTDGKGGGGLFSRFKKNKGQDKGNVSVDMPPDIDTTETVTFDDDTPPKPPLDDSTGDTGDAAPVHPERVDMHPGGYSVNPSDTIQRGPSKMESMKRSFSAFVKPPPKKAGDEETDVVELNKQKDQSIIRCSTFLNVLLACLFVLGIVLTALGTVDEKLYVIGPVMIGLSLFAFVGKVFFTLFWQEDPLPRVTPVVKRMEEKMYHRGRYHAQMQQQQYGYPYWQGGTNVMALQQFNYPAPSMDYNQGYPPSMTYTDGPVDGLPPYDPAVDDATVRPEDMEYGRRNIDGDTSGYQLPDEFQRNQGDYDDDTVERMKRMSEGFTLEMAPSRPSRVSFHNNPMMPQEEPDSLDIGPDLSLGSFPGDPQAQGSFQEGDLDQPIQPPSMEFEGQQATEGQGNAVQKPPASGKGNKNCVIS